MMEPQVVHGPVVQTATNPMYYVTLASGQIVTSPVGFGEKVDGSLNPWPERLSDEAHGLPKTDYSQELTPD